MKEYDVDLSRYNGVVAALERAGNLRRSTVACSVAAAPRTSVVAPSNGESSIEE